MSDRSEVISKLIQDVEFRADYLRAKLNVNIPSQIRALRRRQEKTQTQLADDAGMKQSRISAMEQPGVTAFNVETLVRLAAAFKVGLIVRFAPVSEVLRFENDFSQDHFDVVTIDQDWRFLRPRTAEFAAQRKPDGATRLGRGAATQDSVSFVREKEEFFVADRERSSHPTLVGTPTPSSNEFAPRAGQEPR